MLINTPTASWTRWTSCDSVETAAEAADPEGEDPAGDPPVHQGVLGEDQP